MKDAVNRPVLRTSGSWRARHGTWARLLLILTQAVFALGGSVAMAAASDEAIEEVVVTGTRLSSANAPSPSPVVVVGRDEMEHQGTLRAEDLLNSLPQLHLYIFCEQTVIFFYIFCKLYRRPRFESIEHGNGH